MKLPTSPLTQATTVPSPSTPPPPPCTPHPLPPHPANRAPSAHPAARTCLLHGAYAATSDLYAATADLSPPRIAAQKKSAPHALTKEASKAALRTPTTNDPAADVVEVVAQVEVEVDVGVDATVVVSDIEAEAA